MAYFKKFVCNLQTLLDKLILCVHRSHQPLSSKDSKPRGVGSEAKGVRTRGVSCEDEFTKTTVAFGQLNLQSGKDTVSPWDNKNGDVVLFLLISLACKNAGWKKEKNMMHYCL